MHDILLESILKKRSDDKLLRDEMMVLFENKVKAATEKKKKLYNRKEQNKPFDLDGVSQECQTPEYMNDGSGIRGKSKDAS